MPFTISHAAAVLPLRRLRLPMAAMMIGSMSPDFPYFIPGDVTRHDTHDLEGVFAFCWPAGLLVWLFFVRLLERPSIELLPEPWASRVPRSDSRISPKSLALASLGVIVGALTHVAWDAFTHGNTAVGHLFPVLDAAPFAWRGRSVPVHFILQVLSSVAGLLALAWWAMRLRHEVPCARPHAARIALSDRTRIAILLLMVGVSGAVALASYAASAGALFEVRIFRMLINGMLTGLLAWCAVAAVLAWLRGRGAGARPDSSRS